MRTEELKKDEKDATTVENIKNEGLVDVTTIKTDAESSTLQIESTSKDQSSTDDTVETLDITEDYDESSLPSTSFQSNSPQRRKVLYVNQQQHGKLNVQLELSDINLIVIPKDRNPQLSLLNLLLRSAQKSNSVRQEEEKKRKEEITKENANNNNNNGNDYSKYNYMQQTTNEPSIESRAPYKVDISSTLNSQPSVEITHPSEEALIPKSPMLKVKKPVVYQSPQHYRARRSIENNYVGRENDLVEIENIPIDSEEGGEIINAIEDADNLDEFNKDETTKIASEFMLLGATENCGPGRRRNSYQICVPITEYDQN